MTKLLALDLEQTVIDDIWQGNLLVSNINKISKIVAQEQPDKIVTFSWALIDEPDFNTWAWVQSQLANKGISFTASFLKKEIWIAPTAKREFGHIFK